MSSIRSRKVRPGPRRSTGRRRAPAGRVGAGAGRWTTGSGSLWKLATEGKLLSLRQVVALRRAARKAGRTVVFTNGCFDILHAGHVSYLEAARRQGDILIVGLNTDASVRRLKGKGRPLQRLKDRARVLSALASVDAVVPFGDDTPESVIEKLLPDVLAKGADWAWENIVGRDDVLAAGGRVVRIPLRRGISTSGVIARILKARCPSPGRRQSRS